MSIKSKLNRLKNHISTNPQPREQNEYNEKVSSSIDIPHLDKWEEYGAKPFYFDNSYCFVREVRYPLETKHGIYQFKELKKVVSKWNKAKVDHPLSSKNHRAEDLFFFDTETTGLGGGVGNTIFLLGHARLTDDEIILTQHFLPSPGGEVALYQSFLSSVDYTTLVTYNGKSFDWPQLKTRHTLIRDSLPKLPEFGHFDLYHASRRLWKNKLDSVRLSVVEKEILNIYREKDVPGYLAPMIYFDYIEHKNPEGIFGVMHHNEVDILSLITLYIHLSNLLLSSDDSSSDQFEIARWFDTLGEKDEAKKGYLHAASLENKDSLKAKFAIALMLKQNKKWNEAIAEFHEVYERADEHLKLKTGIELSKLYEHKEKDYPKALQFACEGLEIRNSLQSKIDIEELEKRILRLEKKEKRRNVQ
ncbi:ribonuclease H-like domain-containing protein [Cytobacillus suaedae]|nr:ribonuclease H-like domain-containing protein [Cytobacillus suaedae]